MAKLKYRNFEIRVINLEKEIVLQAAIAEISPIDFTHPGLRTCTFVFCDDQPNENKQGIEYADFAEIKKTAIGTPIKMKFFGTSAGGHLGSIPIGYIKNMYDKQVEGVNQLVAEATLFADEYPDEIQFLHDKFHESQTNTSVSPPGVSWELSYSDSIVRDGIEWLKGLLTRAATFVRHPAYGNRTAILALASNREITEEQMMKVLSELTYDDNSNDNTDKGGNNRMEEELKQAKEELEKLKTSLSEKETEISELNTKVTDLTTAVAEKDVKISTFERNELVTARTAAVIEAGITLPTDPDKLAAKQELYAGLSAEAFAEVIADLSEAVKEAAKAKPKDAIASLKRPERLPKFEASASAEADDEVVSPLSLMTKFKGISRETTRTESE